jgi:hypothetical protein
VCVFLCIVFRLIVVLFCVLCPIVVPLPPGKYTFEVKINNNNINVVIWIVLLRPYIDVSENILRSSSTLTCTYSEIRSGKGVAIIATARSKA